jgi:hypothetical protein
MTSYLFRALADGGYEVPTGAWVFDLDEVARTNDLTPADILPLLRKHINTHLLKDTRLVRDVRYALSTMANELLQGPDFATGIELTARWLTGRASVIRELREHGIVQKVSRYNARSVLRSLLSWLPASGLGGSIVFVNASSLAVSKRSGESLYYTRAAVSDTYEVMREFIDDTDEMRHVMVVFAMPNDFLSIDPTGRGMGAYQALEHRVRSFTESRLANPLANLVWVGDGAEKRTF